MPDLHGCENPRVVTTKLMRLPQPVSWRPNGPICSLVMGAVCSGGVDAFRSCANYTEKSESASSIIPKRIVSHRLMLAHRTSGMSGLGHARIIKIAGEIEGKIDERRIVGFSACHNGTTRARLG